MTIWGCGNVPQPFLLAEKVEEGVEQVNAEGDDVNTGTNYLLKGKKRFRASKSRRRRREHRDKLLAKRQVMM